MHENGVPERSLKVRAAFGRPSPRSLRRVIHSNFQEVFDFFYFFVLVFIIGDNAVDKKKRYKSRRSKDKQMALLFKRRRKPLKNGVFFFSSSFFLSFSLSLPWNQSPKSIKVIRPGYLCVPVLSSLW
jgi:hypothetical protein